MSLNAATIEFLLGKGLTGEDLLTLARSLECDKPKSKGAERQARYRQRKAESATGDVTSDVICYVTSPPNDNISNPPSSDANASGGEPPDPVKQLFDLGVSILTAAGTPDKQARSLIGKWRKAKNDADVLMGLLECKAKAISDPVEWLTKRFQAARYVSASGYEYRGTTDQILKECERRGDNNTYWKVKGDMSREKQSQAAGARG